MAKKINKKKAPKAKAGYWLQVNPEKLTYENLPCVGCKDKLMAAAGMYMDPGPKIPGLAQSISDYYGGYPESDLSPSRVQGPVPIGTPPDTSKVKPGKPLGPEALQSPAKKQGQGYNAGNMALAAMTAFDAILPNRVSKQQVVQPQMAYNPMPYGYGSQALMQDGGSVPMPKTTLKPEQEKSYQEWRTKLPKNLQSEDNYNLRQLWLENPGIKPSANMHFPDKYKLPNHPTFSSESMYFNPTNQYMAGRWNETDSSWNYIPYNSQFKQPVVEMKKNGGFVPKADQGYYMGEDENNSPSAKNGKTMKSKKTKKYDDGGVAPALFGLMDTFYGELGNAKQGLLNAFTGGAGGGLPIPMALGGTLEDKLMEAKDGHWIQKAVNPAHKGYCTPMTKSTCTPRRKALAKTFKKMARNRKKDEGGFIQPGYDQYKEGGIIPDNMSIFSPHDYENGGNVNGGAKINMVDAKYPNTDLMEQWLLYEQGGNVNGGAKLREVGATYPNADLLEQWLLYANGGDLKPSAVKDSDNRMSLGGKKVKVYNTARERDVKYRDDGSALAPMSLVEYNPGYNANIPEPGYNPANLNPKTDYSVTFPQGSSQQTSYFPNYSAWNSFVNNNSNLLISSQERPGSGSAAFKNRPMEQGGNVNGGADIREVGANYPNTDLMEQWLLYKDGGTLSSDKAKEMLRDGTAHGKKLTKKQKQYFGMVAAGKAPTGTTLFGSGDPKPASPQVDQSHFSFGNTPIDRDALLADRIGEIIGNAYDPYSKEGRAVLSQIQTGWNNPQFASDLGVRIKSLQMDPTFQKLTPEQRITRFYETGATGTSGLDDFIRRSKHIGGNPAAYWQGNFANKQRMNRAIPTVTFEQGGVMYDDGGQIDTMWGGSADLESYNPYDGGTVEFNGDSHAQGGIGMAYNGNPVEVEGGEYASKDGDGNLTIYGNMLIPGTKTKFKKAASAIADREKRYDRLVTKGSDLVNGANPASKFEQLKFNAGKVMMQGGQMGMADLASKKEKLASLQRAMLDMAEQHGLDPNAMSQGKMKKAKGGASIPFYQNGGDPDQNDPTRADRNMNPGNIKYGTFAKKYGAKKDKDGFAIFPSKEVGEKAMRDLFTGENYKNMSVSEAIKKWTGGHPYRYDLGPLTDKKVAELGPDELDIVMSTMQKGEGTRYGIGPRPLPGTPKNTPIPEISNPGPFTPYTIPEMSVTPEIPQTKPVNPEAPYDRLNVPNRGKLPSNVEGLKFNQILPELYAMATNKVEPVPAQRYEPQLYTPYQVSFQDRLNQNQAAFNAQMRALGPYNPSAMGTLAAQKYQADQAVLGDQFRTNQSIANDITNKNIALVNDANLKNLGLADTQMVRQSQARSNTKALNQTILNSLSSKYAQNDLENKRLAAYENLYDYRFVPTEDGGQQATYFGPNAMFNYSGRNTTGQKAQDVRTISRYDAQGNLKGYNEYDESDLREMQRILDIRNKQNKMALTPQLSPLK